MKEMTTPLAQEMSPDLPATKGPSEFTGQGIEIIGDPKESSGDLWYLDGRCTQIGCASPPFDPATAPKALLNITPAQHVAWFSLSRKQRVKRDRSTLMHFPAEGQEEDDGRRAHELASHFAEAMLEGRLSAFMKQVSTAEATEKRKAERDEDGKEAIDGFRDAIFAVAWKSTHPAQVTTSAVIDHLRAHPEFTRGYGITESMMAPRTVNRFLKSIGFSWLGGGRKAGRPPKRV